MSSIREEMTFNRFETAVNSAGLGKFSFPNKKLYSGHNDEYNVPWNNHDGFALFGKVVCAQIIITLRRLHFL